MVNKIIEAYSFLQARKARLLNVCENKKAQAAMEYALIFFIAGMGMAASVSLLQTKMEWSLVNQMNMLKQAGEKLF